MRLLKRHLRLVMFSLATICTFILLPFKSQRPISVVNALDDVLTNVISDYLHRFPETFENIPLTRILAIQDSLTCFTEGRWDFRLDQGSHRSGRLGRSKMAHYLLNPSCHSSHRIANLAVELCDLLSAKNVLLVGPEITFHLHSIWLRALEELENQPYYCLGLDFCTFHHICLIKSAMNETSTVDSGYTRFHKPPSKQELISSGTSLLRYVHSTSLHTSNDPKDIAYIWPVVDQTTGVRVRNNYWRAHARKADVIILNRGPLPAPAWTYTDSDLAGNWSFVDQLCLNKSTTYLSEKNSFASRIINAALHATLVSFLPSTIRSLSAVRQDTINTERILIWHGSWYLQPVHPVEHKHSLLIRDLSYPFSPQVSAIDPWSLYYNAQGQIFIYIQLCATLNWLSHSLHAEPSYARHSSSFRVYLFPSGDSFPSACRSSRRCRPWQTKLGKRLFDVAGEGKKSNFPRGLGAFDRTDSIITVSCLSL